MKFLFQVTIDLLQIPLQSSTQGLNALFENLPTNHMLTLRMDVPETWDVQQAYAIQDTNNLRCNSRNGCGDDDDVLADEGTTDQVGSENATIEYG